MANPQNIYDPDPKGDRLQIVSFVGLTGQALADYKAKLAEEARLEQERLLKQGVKAPAAKPVTVTFSRR